jgi:endonuclease YncB( thermonuclease family)
VPTKHSLLQNALILDTETTGLRRGSGIHELAIFDLEKQSVQEYILRPNYVKTLGNELQEHTRLATSPLDQHKGVYPTRWMDVLRAQLVMDNAIKETATDKQVTQALERSNPWLARMLKKGSAPHLQGEPESPIAQADRARVLKEWGVKSYNRKEMDVVDLMKFDGEFSRAVRGRTLWIANAAFEAKQIGAQLGAMQQQGLATDIKATLETASEAADPFYVTGKDINQARVIAQESGDWTGLWKAYKQHPPKAGETAVRDIQDVLRSMTSYGKQLGLLDAPKNVYFGTGMDISFRLFGSLEKDQGLARKLFNFSEVHRAAEDAAITEAYVLRKGLHYTEVLQNVAEESDLGKKYISMAKEGEGPLAEISKYFARLDSLSANIHETNLIKRLERAQRDLLVQGETYQVSGFKRVHQMSQVTPSGLTEQVPRLIPNRVKMTSMDEVLNLIKTEGYYPGVDAEAHLAQMQESIAGKTGQAQLDSLSSHLDKKTNNIVSGQIEAQTDILMNLENRGLGRLVTRNSPIAKAGHLVADAMSQMKVPALVKGWGALAGGLALAGGTWSMLAGNAEPVRETPSLVTYSYNDWLQRQENFYGQRSQFDQKQGMHEGGILGAMRSISTDFGSPYQGMMGSQVVQYDQELLREREKFLRRQYQARHFDSQVGLHGLYGPFKSAIRRKGYSYIPPGQKVRRGKYSGLKGDLLEIDVSESTWKMEVEDADTVALKRGGIRGFVGDMFGLNRSYKFRLAGVDAPETYHGSASYHAPQPGAVESAEAFKRLVEGANDLKLVYDPGETTYGRMMGAVIADGKNLNFEVVRRGLGVSLPFEQHGQEMIDYDALNKLQAHAVSANRGIFARPYFQAFHDITKNLDKPITMNTLTKKDRLSGNLALMDTVSLMEQAESQGFYNTATRTEAARLGTVVRSGTDKLRPAIGGPVAAHYNGYMQQMQRDLGNFTRTRGTGKVPNKFRRQGNYGKLDSNLALDSMGHTNSIWTRRRLKAYENYGSGQAMKNMRKSRMMLEQRRVNKQIFANPVQHNMM